MVDIPLISAIRRQRQADLCEAEVSPDLCEVEVSPVYKVSSRTARAVI